MSAHVLSNMVSVLNIAAVCGVIGLTGGRVICSAGWSARRWCAVFAGVAGLGLALAFAGRY